MATDWKVTVATAVVGWLMSPVIRLLLPKIFSCLVFDPSKKLLELKIHIIPELENTLRAVDEQRMLERGKKSKSVVSTLDEMAAMLRHAREDTEDIFDDAQEKIELYRNRCWQRLYVPVKASVASGYGTVKAIIAVGYGTVKACIAFSLEIMNHGSWHHIEIDEWTQSLATMQDILKVAYKGGDATQLRRGEELVGALANLQHRLETASSRDDAIRICQTEWADDVMANLHQFLKTASGCDANATQMHHRDELLDWLQQELSGTKMGRFCDAVAACKRSFVWILQLVPNWFKQPVQGNADQTASHDHHAVTIDSHSVGSHGQSLALPVAPSSCSTSAYQRPVAVTLFSESWGGGSSESDFSWWGSSDTSDEPAASESTPSCSSFGVFRNHCISIFHRLVDVHEKACVYRDWSYAGAGITGNQENTHVFDFVLNAISRHNLKKRIEKVESTVSEVKKSPLLNVASKSVPDDVANKNRSKIRMASNRKVFGREAFRDSIMAKLRETTDCDAASSSTSPCYSVIGIYGVAGSGKTTFAQYTSDYIKEECKEEGLFDTIICIHVTETFSVDDIFHEMLKDITTDRHSDILDHEELKEKLKESLYGKRFCLILDDLWVNTKNDPRLEELISPLNVGLKGSKILVTARTKVSVAALCADEPMEMPDLDEDQYLSMFMHYALGGTGVVDEEFIHVGRLIVEKLHRSPIAAVIVAGRLGANRDINVWNNAAKLHILNDTMDALWWSYQQLSPDIRRCFEYCNIFPRRFQMKKSHLVHLWIAQGFVKTSYVTEDMEDVAERYIQELVSYSFLHQQEKTCFDDEELFRIHDLLRDLADIVTRTDCCTIDNESGQRGEGDNENISQDVRHLFIQNYDAELITKKILGLGNLVTLIINVVGNDTLVEEKVIGSICKKLPKLRVLAFAMSNNYSRTSISIPESLSQLKHLRYLACKTYGTRRITLPRTLNELQHIQLLNFDTSDISEFAISELANLRHLFCGPYVLHSYFGRLSSLRTTPCLIVGKEEGHELKQLKHLNKVRGKLTICGLENVRSKEQALEANLAVKRLTELRLEWHYDYDTRCSRTEAEVLAGLCHGAGLKKLVMWYFTGWRCLRKDNGCLNNLQELCLFRCSSPEPAYVLAEVFPRLLVLEFSDCSWDALPGQMENLTLLKDLSIMLCKNILFLPTLPKSLKKFHLYKCDRDFMKSCNTDGHSNWKMIQHIPDKNIISS